MFGMLNFHVATDCTVGLYERVRDQYFDTMCALALYIVMAIGADDAPFGLTLTNRVLTKHQRSHLALRRVCLGVEKAASAMLVTSLTTCAAFTATATSPLLSIQSFGYYTAVVIFLDYVYVSLASCCDCTIQQMV